MIIKMLTLVVVMLLTACSNLSNDSDNKHSYLYVDSGADIIPAVVKNPHPDCNKVVNVARLDAQPELQIYVDVAENGAICK
jgi:hypothetical protein